MAGPHHGWLYGQGSDGVPYEIINQARLAAYLRSPALTLPSGFSICDVLNFGGCEAYAYKPPCDAEPAYIDWPGGAGNNQLSVPDASPLDISGDLTIIADIAPDDWTPAGDLSLLTKSTTAANISYGLAIQGGTGTPYFFFTTNGSTLQFALATASMGVLSNGERRALRVDFDADNGAAGRTIKFFTAMTYNGPWVQLGANVVIAGITPLFSGSSAVTFGSSGQFAGRLYYSQLRNGISGGSTVGGSPALTIDPNVITSITQTTFLAVTGQTVTITRAGSPGIRLYLGPNVWEPEQYLSPVIDEAPWYNQNRPESADAFGFFVEEWTGLDSAHVQRPVSASGTYRSALGALSARERVMKLNVLIVARTEQATEYLFRWLEGVLSDVCSGCGTSAMYFRRFCPTGNDKGEGVGEIRQVGLSESLTWESDPVDGGSCFLRRLSFSLTAADPCIYVNGTTAAIEASVENMTTCLAGMAISSARRPCRPQCQELPASCRNIFTYEVQPLETAAPVLKLVNDSADWSMPLRAIAYANPGEMSLTVPNALCGLPRLGEVYVAPLPPWSELVWDVAARDVKYYDHSTGDYTSGWAFIDANDRPLPRFFPLPCGTGHVVLEPASACLSLVSTRWMYNGLDLGTLPHYPTATVQIQERLGCP